MGGSSQEREISLISGRECAAALRDAGFRSVTEIDVSRTIVADLAKADAQVCFNALHGPLGEDGSIQGMLNVLGIPYTHSGVRASSIAMHKELTKKIATAIGIRCPAGLLMDRAEFIARRFDSPYVIKPINDGSSVHTYIVCDPTIVPFDLAEWPYSDLALVEEFFGGSELTVAVLDGKALTVTEIFPANAFYDYEAKYGLGKSRHVLPANIPPATHARCLEWALAIHHDLGCRGISRSDFLYDRARGEAGLYFLEINTQPGMTLTSLAPEQARHCGIALPELVLRLVALAVTD